jgi:tellurite resistance protein TerA
MGIDYTKRGGSGEATASTPPAGGGVNLSKVVLTKSAPTVSLTKAGAAAGLLRVNLNWDARPATPTGGFFKRARGGGSIDLDLGCLYEFTDGAKGVVQALGNAFEAWSGGSQPVIRLDGDDRSGTNSGGENLIIDLSQLSTIKRIIVFAFIYEGVANWAQANGVVTLFPQSGPQVEVRLDEAQNGTPMCAIAQFVNTGGELSLSREVRYINGGQDKLDAAYGWGMDWSPGRK